MPGNDQMPEHLGANHRGSRIKGKGLAASDAMWDTLGIANAGLGKDWDTLINPLDNLVLSIIWQDY